MELLLIEDDAAMRTALSRALERRGLRVHVCADGGHALGHWRRVRPHVVLLDLSLPGQDGLRVLEQARREGLGQPVLIITARGTVGDRVLGLNTGADDYLAKPFDLDELEARVRALHRRHAAAAAQVQDNAQRLGRLRWDTTSGAIELDDQVLDLPPRERALLHALLARPGHAVARDRLVDHVFHDDPQVAPEAIDVVVYRLRKRLAGSGVTVMTLRGLGYLLKLQP